jgi:hypothetical protein
MRPNNAAIGGAANLKVVAALVSGDVTEIRRHVPAP